MSELYFRNINVVDVRNQVVHANQTVGIAGGVFIQPAEIPSNAMVIEGDGKYISPGIIDAHVHLVWDGRSPDPMSDTEDDGNYISFARGAAHALDSLRSGVTMTRDVGCNDDCAIPLASAINRGILQGCRILPCGGAIQGVYGHCPMIGTICNTKYELIAKIKELKAMFTQFRIAPPHWIKIMASGGAAGLEDVGPCMYSEEELAAIVHEAHRLNIKVAAHALSYDAISKCVDAGIDSIEHGADLTEDILKQMAENGQTWVPTLAVYKTLAEGRGVVADHMVDRSIEVTRKQQTAFLKAMEIGTNIIAGSDAGSANFGPHPSILGEMAVMEEYGMPIADVLTSATIRSAETLGLKDYGEIAPGYKADFVILDADPLSKGVAAYINDLDSVYKDGILIK